MQVTVTGDVASILLGVPVHLSETSGGPVECFRPNNGGGQAVLSRFCRVLGRRGGDRGSMTVEFVIVVPVLIVLMLFLVMAGRVYEARGQADGAARDAARAASIALDPGDAQTWADQAITDDGGSNVTCAQPTVDGFAAWQPLGDRDRAVHSQSRPRFRQLDGHWTRGIAARPLRCADVLAMARIADDPRPADRGSITLFAVIFTMAVIFLALMLADFGNLMNAEERAADTAEQAARAAADTLNPADLRDGRSSSTARRPARPRRRWSTSTDPQWDRRRPSPTARAGDPIPRQATVTVMVTTTPILSAFLTGGYTVKVTESACAEFGITTGAAC